MILKKESTKLMFFTIAVALVGSAIFILHNIKAVKFNCFNVYDAAIYPQALMEMATNLSLNPFTSLRNVKILNDHFDPILIFMIPWVRLVKSNIIGIYLIDIFWVWLTLMLLASTQKRWSTTAIIWSMLFLAKAIVYPLTHPMLTTTWSMFACAWLIWSVHKKNSYAIFCSALFLCLFREEYPFAIGTLSLFYLWKREWKLSIALIFISLAFLFFIFHLRPLVLGQVEHYGEGALKNLIISPIDTLTKSFLALDRGVFSIYYPFIPPFILLFLKGNREQLHQFKNNTLIPTLLFLLPLLTIRLIFQKFYFHYSVPIVITLIMLVALSEIPSLLLSYKKILYITLLLFGLSAASNYTKIFKLLIWNSSAKCIITPEKELYTQQLLKQFSMISPNKTILATGGVAPQIVTPNKQLYHLGGIHAQLSQFDYLLLEKGEKTNIWPLQNSDVDKVISACSQYISQTLSDNPYYLLVEGPFPSQCLDHL
ncbi:MAG: hypothetical protein U0T83_00260 [Bacteriovoracaceae bacterium]